MKIAYIAQLDTAREGGVSRKIAGQSRAWRQAGHEVRLFILSTTRQVWASASDLPIEVIHSRGRWLGRFSEMRALVRRVLEWGPDLAYMRFGVSYPAFGRLMSTVPTIHELNTDDLAEARWLRPATRVYHGLTRAYYLRKARGLVAVTHELAERFARFGRPVAVVSNGVDLANHARLPPAHNPTARIVFSASSIQPWHGLDKILWLSRQMSQVQFDLIGPAVADLGQEPAPNLSAHGYLPRAYYEAILAQADVAAGTLALHRKAMDEACALKVREYLAYGLPTLIGYRDTDFPQPTPFVLELPNTPDNVETNVAVIRDFARAWQDQRVPREAIAHLDTRVKERERLAFFEKALSAGSR